MGMILIERYDPDFPQLHTRLSLTYFQTGDPENALREAKAAIAENPNNPAAHLNAGLDLADMCKFDAANSEFQASIRSKPDYARAYVGLGRTLDDLHDFDGAMELPPSIPTTPTRTTTWASPMGNRKITRGPRRSCSRYRRVIV